LKERGVRVPQNLSRSDQLQYDVQQVESYWKDHTTFQKHQGPNASKISKPRWDGYPAVIAIEKATIEKSPK